MSFDFTSEHNVTDAILYARVSSKAQLKRGDGLASQETRCRAYAEFKTYNIVKTFTDDLTGKRKDRAGVQNLLAFLKRDPKKQYVVIIDDVTRFARRVPVHFELRDEIQQAGGILESPSMVFRDDADGEFQEYILASAAQHQSRKNAEQTRHRMEARCRNGYWPFCSPIGYKHITIKGQRGKVLVRDEPIASIIQEGLEGFASGRFDTQAEVKRFLESHPAFPRDLPNGEIRFQRVTNILERVIYSGYVEAPKWGITIREGHHEGLITLATHQKIQDRIDGSKKAPARKDLNADFPLRGFVVCGDCEKPLTACWSTSKSGKRHPYYLCHNRQCASKRKSIPRDTIEGEFETILRELKPSENLFRLAKIAFKSAWDQRYDQLQSINSALRSDIAKFEKQIELLVDRIVESESSTAITAYEKRIAKLEKSKQLAAEKLAVGFESKRPFNEMFEHALQFLANPWKLWVSDRLEDKRTVLKLSFQG